MDDLNMSEVNAARREALEKTIHSISMPELKALGEHLFPNIDHPWREAFFRFLEENGDSSFYHASTEDRVHVIYCPAKERGMWFMPGSGKGVLQEKGLRAMKEIVAGLR